MHRIINYLFNGYQKSVTVEISVSENVKIPEQTVNKALMIAMNYLIENMETDKQESAE